MNTDVYTEKIKSWAIERGLRVTDYGVKYKGVKGFPNHIVTSNGSVFVMSYTDENGRTRRERELKQRTNADGYKYVFLTHKGRKKSTSVHRIMGEAFIPNPKNKETINHIDG